MPAAGPKRATVYFDAALHKALRLKAAETERSISDVVAEAGRSPVVSVARLTVVR